MITRALTLAVLWLWQAPAQPAPTVFPSPRLAAIAFAVTHGFEIPRVNLIVANEIETGQVNHGRGSPNDRARSLPVEQGMRDSQAIARFLGPDVKFSITGTRPWACRP